MSTRMTPEPKTDADKSLLEYLVVVAGMRAGLLSPTAGFLFASVEEFVLSHGTFFTPQPLPATVKPMRLQQCFENAYRVAGRTDAYHYVEGYAISVIPTLHAWLIDKQGNVIDPTWGAGVSYCGVELSLDQVRASRRKGSLTVLSDWQRDFPALAGVPVLAKNAWFLR